MKKLNYLLIGAAALLMASCANDDLKAPGGDGNLQITVNLPGQTDTRADDATPIPMLLNYAVFDSDNQWVEDGVTTFTGTSTTLNLNLLSGKTYNIAFFAQSAQSAGKNADGSDNTSLEPVYTFTPSTTIVNVDYTAMKSADSNGGYYDCYSNTYNTVNGTSGVSVTLTRPVAQINWGTDDLGAASVEKIFGENGESMYATLSTKAYSSYDILNASLEGTQEKVVIGAFQAPDETYPAGTNMQYVARQYLLAGSPSALYDLNLNVSNSETGEAVTTDVVVTSAPLQANYRTNIYGSLLTDNVNLSIDLAPWGIFDNEVDTNIEITPEGTVYCKTPKLPAGVTVKSMEDNNAGAVAIGEDGKPEYFQATGTALNTAMQKYSEIYLAPNVNITTTSHEMNIPEKGVTIHGNGATITGQEHDFAIAYKTNTYADGSTVNLTINNLNGVKIWNAPVNKCTVNVNLINCTATGTGITDGTSLIMTRVDDSALATINFNLQNCYVQNTQVAIHSTLPGTMVFNNCVFDKVGIPINIAKKLYGAAADITVSNCKFNTCGIPEGTTAWNYAAPVRVVDNGGPDYSINLLVEGCIFTNTVAYGGYDILLWDYRAGTVADPKVSYPVKYSIKNCTPSDPKVETITEKVVNDGTTSSN